MMTPEQESRLMGNLPPEITGRLRAMIRRVRRIILIRGTLTSVAVLLGCSLTIMAIDAGVMIFSSAVRWLLSAGALAFVLATAWRSLVRPLMRPLTLTRMARVLETRHPELQERISSALELLSMGGSAGATGSEQLIQLLAREAQADISNVTPSQEFTGKSLKPVLVGGGIIVGIFALLLIVWPHQTSLLFARSLLPGANLAGLQGAGLEVEPGDFLCLQGSELTLSLKVENRDRTKAEVHTETASGDETVERMLQVSPEDAEPALYDLTFPMVTESFRYRIRYGTGLTRYYDVTVLPPPAPTRMVITCQYPEYTKKAAIVLPEGQMDIVGLAGGSVKIEADFNRAAEGVVLLGDQQVEGEANEEGGASWTFALATNTASRWGLALRDTHGFSNRVGWASLSVVPDRVPRVVLHTPKLTRLYVSPIGTLEFGCVIDEDFGLARHEIVLESEGSKTPVKLRVPMEVASVGNEEWSGRAEVDFGKLELRGELKFRAWVSVIDTLPPEFGGPQEGVSREIEITIKENAASIKAQEREKHLEDILGMLTSSAELLVQAADGVEAVKARTATDPMTAPVLSGLGDAEENAGTALKRLVSAAQIAAITRFESLAPRIAYVAREAVSPAWVSTKDIQVVAAAKRPSQSDTAIASLRAAAAEILKLITAMKELNEKLAEQDRIEDMALQEKALAQQARQEMTEEEMEEWLKKQAALAKKLANEPRLEGSKARNFMGLAQQNMEKAKQQMASAGSDKEDQKKETEEPKGQDSKGSGGKGGKQNPGDDKKDHKPPKSHKKSKGKGMGKGAAGGEGMTPGKPGASAQMAASEAAEMAAEAMSQYLPKPGSAPPAGKGKGGGKGGSSLMPGGAFVYIPGTFDIDASDADWARIKGTSDAGATSDKLKEIPPEYRGLVRKYFIELAREGARRKEMEK